jgi:hypothetical protein
MEQDDPYFNSTFFTRGVNQSKIEESFLIHIRQGTSKEDEGYDLIKHYQARNYKVSDIRVSTLRPHDNSLPHILDISFVPCVIGVSPSIIELPLIPPLAHQLNLLF